MSQLGSSKKLNSKRLRLNRTINKHPLLLFGLPFMAIILGSSFLLTPFTQIRFDHNDQKIKQLSKEDELKIKRGRKKLDIREEYYKMQQAQDDLDGWDQVRVPRLKGEIDGILK